VRGGKGNVVVVVVFSLYFVSPAWLAGNAIEAQCRQQTIKAIKANTQQQQQ